jgi:hypothetical protein
MNSRTKISSIIGIVVLVATVLIYVIAEPVWYPCTGLGFGFMLYGEIILFAGIAVIEYWAQRSSGLMTRAGMGVAIEGYAILVIVSSFVYMTSQSYFVRGFLILQILLFVAAFVAAFVIANASKGRRERDTRVLQADATIKDFENRLILIRENTERKKDIDRLIDGVKYSDTSVNVDADVQLHDSIGNLENMIGSDTVSDEELTAVIDEIEFLIKKRNLQTRVAKQGGI